MRGGAVIFAARDACTDIYAAGETEAGEGIYAAGAAEAGAFKNTGGGFELSFSFGQSVWRFDGRDFLYEADNHLIRQENLRRGRDYAEKRAAAVTALRAGFAAEDAADYIFPGLDRHLDKAARVVDIAPTDARLCFYPERQEKFRVIPEKSGRSIDRTAAKREILAAFLESPRAAARLKTVETQAAFKRADAEKGTRLKSRFSTAYESSSEERKHNIALSARSISGRRLEPGEEFSFNGVVGKRSEERGYRTAKIIIGGKFEPGVGGGVCQTSTTVYNAALLAGMRITEANHHSLPVGYVRPSFDAMVNGSSSDLCFVNDGTLPVFIGVYADGSKLTAEFYGEENAYTLERRSETVREIPFQKDEKIIDTEGKYADRVQYKGETARIINPKNGLVSKGYLRYLKNGKLIREELIRTDRYEPQNGLSVEGAREPPPPAPEPNPEPLQSETGQGFLADFQESLRRIREAFNT